MTRNKPGHTAIRCTILLLASLLVTLAYADQDDAQPPPWQGAQAQGNVIRGNFTQKKHLAELERPLVSTGTFVLARGRGLIWQVEQPVSTQLVITRHQLVERNNGRETARISAEKQPGLRVVAAVLLAVFQGDTDRLQQFFDVASHQADADSERMTLRPATRAVGEFVERVRIEGGKHIEHIRIDQPGGDYSDIELKTRPQPAGGEQTGLSAHERAAFAH